jgi:hypothetical protein
MEAAALAGTAAGFTGTGASELVGTTVVLPFPRVVVPAPLLEITEPALTAI